MIIFISLFIALTMSLIIYWILPRGLGTLYLVGAFLSVGMIIISPTVWGDVFGNKVLGRTAR